MHLRGHQYAIGPCETSPIPPLPIKILHEWPQSSMHIVQYSAVPCILEDIQCKILRISTQNRYNTVQYCLHDLMCKCAMSLNCDWGRSAIWPYHQLHISLQSSSSLAGGKNTIPQTGVTLAYTINPFGSSAGHVFIYLNRPIFCKFVIFNRQEYKDIP